jgi:hypothetical protein
MDQPVASVATAQARDPAEGNEPGAELLTREEIEAILEREAAGLPPEAGAEPPPLRLVTREPGSGRHGRWTGWIWLAIFVAMVVMQTVRG